MYMEKAMDAGDILSQIVVPINDNDNCGTMFEKLSYAGRDLLIDTIEKLVDDKITPIKQDETEVSFAYNVTKEEELLDFNMPAKDVFNHIRAYNPAPIAKKSGHVHIIGDASKVGNLRTVIWGAWDVCMKI